MMVYMFLNKCLLNNNCTYLGLTLRQQRSAVSSGDVKAVEVVSQYGAEVWSPGRLVLGRRSGNQLQDKHWGLHTPSTPTAVLCWANTLALTHADNLLISAKLKGASSQLSISKSWKDL